MNPKKDSHYKRNMNNFKVIFTTVRDNQVRKFRIIL